MKPDASSGRPAAPQKPLRFVHNLDGPFAKRRRINTACLTCRRRKTRCSGERPKCWTCQRDELDCTYGVETKVTGSERKSSQKNDKHVMLDGQKEKEEEGRKHLRSPARTSASIPTLDGAYPGQPIDPQLVELSHPAEENRFSKTFGTNLKPRNKMPYFRYFGPTAIMPGFKQMVVKVKNDQHGSGYSSSDQHVIPPSPAHPSSTDSPLPGTAPSPIEIPMYDASALSPSPLITHLCTLFFDRLGCTFPFLQRERFLRDLEEKQVDAILVDTVCALAARFSTHPLLASKETPRDRDFATHASERGQLFAQRAKCAIPDAFGCPSVAVVQAALLLAYDEFGANRDSGLWMYLGIAIRMAQDLGMHTRQGLKLKGLHGLTPQSALSCPSSSASSTRNSPAPTGGSHVHTEEGEQMAAEQERLDTFWAIFFLDRVISSGTGRPATMRDCDIEIAFPSLNVSDSITEWPSPFPAAIRIIHLYGCVADIINRIKTPEDVTIELRARLASLEDRLTILYQNLSPKLHFNAINFQQYVKLNHGPNFLIMHYWFHTMIVLLHQPTLLKTFEGTPQSLSTNSRELSMSSAKTIADILAFTELIDAGAGLASPFASQPVYIAACAFLKESAVQVMSSRPPTRAASPALVQPEKNDTPVPKHDVGKTANRTAISDLNNERKQAAKHSLLASAAKQNYQHCYRALKALESYWAGVKYIVTVLDQKSEGVLDPLLYTSEEVESALEEPRLKPTYNQPGWRRKLTWGAYLIGSASGTDSALQQDLRLPNSTASPAMLPNQALGWSLTGTLNSPSTNVAVMYALEQTNPRSIEQKTASDLTVLQAPLTYAEDPQCSQPNSSHAQSSATQAPGIVGRTSLGSWGNQINTRISNLDPAMISDADLLLNLHSPFPALSSPDPGTLLHPIPDTYTPGPTSDALPLMLGADLTADAYSNMVIDTQDIDLSLMGADMMPWDLEYLPTDAFGLNVLLDSPPLTHRDEPDVRPNG